MYQGSAIANPIDLAAMRKKVEETAVLPAQPPATNPEEKKANKQPGYHQWEDYVNDVGLLWKHHEKIKPADYEIAVSLFVYFILLICFAYMSFIVAVVWEASGCSIQANCGLSHFSLEVV